MFERIEADPAELPGGIVAQPVGDKSVGGLMKGDRNQDREHPNRDGVK